MNIKLFLRLVGTVFSLIALVQLLRIIYAWEVTLNGSIIPFWVSWIAIIVVGSLAFMSFRMSQRV